MYLRRDKKDDGFTLIEALLIIAGIAILTALVIIAINPGKQLANSRNAQRESDIHAIYNAVSEFFLDNLYWPASTTISSTLIEICDDSNTPSGCIDLDELVPEYLSEIPRDPTASTTGKDYLIAIDNKNKIIVTAPNSTEYFQSLVAIGTTTPGVGGDVPSADPDTPVGNVLSFDGSNDYVLVSNSASLDVGTADFSLSFWAKTSTTGTSQVGYVNYESGASNNYWGIQAAFSDNKVRFFANSSSSQQNWESTTEINDGDWHHILVVVDRDTDVKIYVDGTEETLSSTGTIATINSDLGGSHDHHIGALYPSTQTMNGFISDVRLYTEALSVSEASSLYTGTDPDDTNLQGWWKLNEGTGTSATDSSANSNTGTISGSTWTVAWEPKGDVLSFDAVGDYVQLPDSADFDVGSGDFTVVGWVNPETAGGDRRVFSFRQSGENTKLTAFITDFAATDSWWFGFYSVATNWRYVQSNASAAVEDVWQHMAFVRSGNTLYIYKDGAEIKNAAISSFTAPDWDQGGTLGTELGESGIDFSGYLNDIRFYSEALSAGDISALYASSTNPDNTNLKGHWILDEGSGTTATDSSASGNNGTINNASWATY